MRERPTSPPRRSGLPSCAIFMAPGKRIVISSTVLPAVFAQPSRLDFRTVDASRLLQPLEREIQIVALPGIEFKVTSVQAQNGLFLVRSEKRANLPWRIIASLPAGAKPGIYRDRILIETDAKQAPRLVVKVSAVVK